MPISAGVSPRSRTAYTMNVAQRDVREQVRRRRRGGDAAQVPVAEHVAQPVGDLLAQALARPAVLVDMRVRRRLVAPDREDEQPRQHDS